MLLLEEERQSRVNKLFLLVFHGGLVCYLFLHNFIIPLVKNLGQNNFILKDFQYYFIPQLWLWFIFVKIDLSRKKESNLPLVITFNVVIGVVSLGFLLINLRDGFSTNEFSTSISLMAIGCFFLGFFIYFKKFFLWNLNRFKKQYFGGFVIGIIFACFQNNTTLTKPIVSAVKENKKINYIDKTVVRVSLPSNRFTSGKIAIKGSGFENQYSLLSKDRDIILMNQSTVKYLIRIEYMRDENWYFKKVVNIKPNSQTSVSLPGQGIYKFNSPSRKKIGFYILVKGSDLFEKKTYFLSDKKIEVY